MATPVRGRSRQAVKLSSSLVAAKIDQISSGVEESSWPSAQVTYLFVCTCTIVTCLKFLLIPSYHSTDFEVHRNWMAITSSLPLSQWYTEATSQWTLDYPPFFAYFELALSKFAPLFDRSMLTVSATPYLSPSTLFYQRLTVIVSDLWYYYAVWQWLALLTDPARQTLHGLTLCCGATSKKSDFGSTSGSLSSDPTTSAAFVYTFLFVFNVGHLIVDHIHFQYNGLLNGFLLLSLMRAVNGQIYWAAFWFAVLLNFKHIYLYMAPAYGLYLFVEHCVLINRQSLLDSRLNLRVLFSLAAIVVAVFGASFGPFILNGQFWPLVGRLFPFQRGLTHAYWAPNAWALYTGLDVVLAKLMRKGGVGGGSGQTGGLVQQSDFAVLPSISPEISLALVAVVISIISLIYVYNRVHSAPASSHIRRRRSVVFLELVCLSTLTFFILGYHVHEKAILLVTPVLIPLVFAGRTYARVALLLSTTGYFALFPLLYQSAETPIKVLLLATHVFVGHRALGHHFGSVARRKGSHNSGTKAVWWWWWPLPLLSGLESVYVVGLIPLQLLYSVGPTVAPHLFVRYPFVPLMAVSLYCSLGVLYCYATLARQMVRLGSKEEAFKLD